MNDVCVCVCRRAAKKKPDMADDDPFRTLGIGSDASTKEVKDAYRKLGA